MFPQQLDLPRATLAVLFIVGLIVTSFLILQPFLPAIVWSTTLVIATWPLMLWVQEHTGNRRALAVLIMTVALLLVLIIPFWLAVGTIVANRDQLTELARAALSIRVPAPPSWLAEVPLFGATAAEMWGQVTSAGLDDLTPRLTPYAGAFTQWFASAAGGLAGMFVQFLLTTVLAACIYAQGEKGAEIALGFGRRLGGDRGEMVILLIGRAVRGVALGVVVTALAQSALGGIALLAVGVPFAPVLTALMFMLCLVQIGPGLVLFPAAFWMYYSGDTVWASVLLVMAVITVTMDNFLRPFLIKKGADLPILLIFGGVVGGLIAFGMLGIFLGPTILAVAYTLLNMWISAGRELTPMANPGEQSETGEAVPGLCPVARDRGAREGGDTAA
ncbi:MAG TPA: AI-2E family transporter YdiK [Xanthobacteraceae bacterium]|jgi:predicted PurR-regulated permease PerM|nr:MAG: hypothetical protein B7Z41_03265 [Rhizobiales bacterium 12-66-7]HQS07436.1 AI-2E family transporter YdiK [Xanthobacteraceae bacterium]